MVCAKERINYAKRNATSFYDIAIAIESDLENKDGSYFDCANVRIELGQMVGIGHSNYIKCPNLTEEFGSQERIVYSKNIWGYGKTGGNL